MTSKRPSTTSENIDGGIMPWDPIRRFEKKLKEVGWSQIKRNSERKHVERPGTDIAVNLLEV